MFLRSNPIATSTLWLITLSGVSSIVGAADTKPIVRETCAQVSLVGQRHAGHPGKSVEPRKAAVRQVERCSSALRKPLILASYTDARGGQALVRGRTELALELLSSRSFARASAAELTNMCVGQTVLRQWSQARDACDAAVARALADRAGTSRWPSAYREAVHTAVAVGAAYSNRAVMHWLSGNEVAAQSDLVHAQNLTPDASYVMRNLEVAERKLSLVRAEADQSSIG
jgi:hypothetical protein